MRKAKFKMWGEVPEGEEPGFGVWWNLVREHVADIGELVREGKTKAIRIVLRRVRIGFFLARRVGVAFVWERHGLTVFVCLRWWLLVWSIEKFFEVGCAD